MKIFINKTEDWESIDASIAFAQEYLKDFNIKIDSKFLDFKAEEESYYTISKSKNRLTVSDTKSIKGMFIRSFGISNGGLGYDYYGIIVDKRKSKQTFSLYGQHENLSKTIEVYAVNKNKTKYGMNYDTYTLIHEILHAIASFYGVPDTLHEYVENRKNKTLDAYIGALKALVSPKMTRTETIVVKEGKSWQYFKLSEKTGNFGTVADLKPELVDMADIGRGYSGIPWKITSGFRTPEYNKNIGGAVNSDHLTGDAIDVLCRNDEERWKIIDGAMKAGFRRFGIGEGFVHIGLAKHKAQGVMWTYYK